MKDLIKQLTEAYGPPGYEQVVRDLIVEAVAGQADSVETDALGNLHVVKRGSGEGLRIMLAAHLDEIGLMVSHINDKGLARFTPLGGVRPETMVGNRALFTNGALGVISVDNWLRNEKPSYQTLYLDFGTKDNEAAPVQVGDVAAFQRPFVDLGDTLVAKSLDDRVGCTVLVETSRRVKNSPHEIHFVFTVQEEVGSRGATTAAYKVDPDLSLAIDVTDSGGDIPERKHGQIKMGHGPAITVMDRQMLSHPKLRTLLIETAATNGIPYQLDVLTMGSTDAKAMQRSRTGNAACTLSIPCRHVHTPSEMVSYRDVRHLVDWLTAFLSAPIKL